MNTVLAVVIGYALGCLVGAYYIVRIRTGADIRASGSGNAGARNVYRSGDKVGAALALIWDVGKGALAVLIAWAIAWNPWAHGLALIAVVAGHIWPAQLRFRGGKGVAPAIGATLQIVTLVPSWQIYASAAVAWTLVIAMHHPIIDRRRKPPAPLSARENKP